MDAKLQIWDLSVSSIEPVVTIDTTTDDTPANTEIAEEKEELDEYGLPSEHNANSNNNTLSPTLGNTRYDRTLINEKKVDEDNSSTLAKLLKQLAKDPEKKSLTTLQFGEKNPTIVVGDNRGSVSVYRIFDPLIITHLGPLQQTKKLKDSVMRLTDPASIAILTNAEKGEDEKK